ncbi:MAG: hypothetical protein LC775_12825, partial [Acidobacteria bacterium]|nr:hypothetical protein [Acidobacteriota bacterium]
CATMNVSPRDDSSFLYLPGRQLTEYPGTEVVEERSIRELKSSKSGVCQSGHLPNIFKPSLTAPVLLKIDVQRI